jgi:UDP-N-acetylglucosamine--N-acetylmuramyl-(pentapeptide) pyrophosphoryl-undecaprenol N-acetylglucosamine transferase
MGAALASADLVVARAGASSLGEFPLFGLPAILAPYPYAWRYQQTNGQYLAQRGAAEIVQDASLRDQLLPLVKELLGDPQRLQGMQKAMKSLAQPDPAEKIARLLKAMAGSSDPGEAHA